MPGESRRRRESDLLVGLYIPWDPIMSDEGPIRMHRLELQNLVPVGS